MQQLAEQLLLAVKTAKATDLLLSQLAQLKLRELLEEVATDTEKKAFWINLYNAFFLLLRVEKGMTKPAIYREQVITVAQIPLSLDDIEHGILRKYRWKWSLGYLPQLFPSPRIKALAVAVIDPRIHFALNCGAKSCPPIAFYQVDRLEGQLDIAAQSFLEQETTVYPEKKEIHTSRLMQWYAGDFGGTRSSLRLLGHYLDGDYQGWKLVYTTYDWSEELGNFV